MSKWISALFEIGVLTVKVSQKRVKVHENQKEAKRIAVYWMLMVVCGPRRYSAMPGITKELRVTFTSVFRYLKTYVDI